jgi:hypothetical protein
MTGDTLAAEEQLVASARAAAMGDRAAAHQVLQAVQDGVYRLALRMLGHPQDAEDATQEILVIVNLPGEGPRRYSRSSRPYSVSVSPVRASGSTSSCVASVGSSIRRTPVAANESPRATSRSKVSIAFTTCPVRYKCQPDWREALVLQVPHEFPSKASSKNR